MNKDVIYIEPEDDITDIITKIENSKEKIVALVPPKKAGVFRSVVNIKLISKAGLTSEKTVVLVTVDPSIIKLAAATKIPVTKDLQTPPAIPKADLEMEETSEEEVIEASEESEEEKAEEVLDEEIEDDEEEEGEEKEEPKKKKKSKKSDKQSKKSEEKSSNPIINWIKTHKKTTIFGGIAFLLLIVFLVWAFAIAPSATITVEMQTESKSFSENITFTTKATEENVKDGKFYLQEKKIESVQEVKFDATGKKNNGEKAKGEVVVYAFFRREDTISINNGATFSINGLTYTANSGTSLFWDGKSVDECNNKGQASAILSGCQISARIPVTASDAGSKYNISASQSGWSTVANVDGVYSDKAMEGGTDNIVTVVEQSDIEKAKDQLKASNESENKQKLYDSVGDDMMIIESSFKQETATAESKPAAGEEVKEGETPILKATTTATVYVLEESKLKEFIAEKAKIDDDQKIYEIKDPFIENFAETNSGYVGRLKTNYAIGPKITDNEILEMVKGKGVGDAQHDLKNINGVVSVSIDTSYPWVSVIPGDSNKITINIEVKEK